MSTDPMVAVAGPPLRFRNKRIAEPKCCWGAQLTNHGGLSSHVWHDKILTSIAKMDWNVFKTHGLLYLGGDLEPTRETIYCKRHLFGTVYMCIYIYILRKNGSWLKLRIQITSENTFVTVLQLMMYMCSLLLKSSHAEAKTKGNSEVHFAQLQSSHITTSFAIIWMPHMDMSQNLGASNSNYP